jgi:subtilisin-like proprotein convertase family protein
LISIPDNLPGGIVSEITVPQNAAISGVAVEVDISHSNV